MWDNTGTAVFVFKDAAPDEGAELFMHPQTFSYSFSACRLEGRGGDLGLFQVSLIHPGQASSLVGIKCMLSLMLCFAFICFNGT